MTCKPLVCSGARKTFDGEKTNMGAAASCVVPDKLKNHSLSKNEIDSYLLTFFNFEDHADANGTITYGAILSLLMTKYDVFLTHDWGAEGKNNANHLCVMNVCERLEKKHIKSWLDHVRMENNVHETMIEGIDASSVVVVFITPRYIDKVGGTNAGDNCKFEFNYASRMKTATKMLGVIMDGSIRNPRTWKGPVGFILGGDIYVDCVAEEEESMTAQIEELYSRIVSKLGGTSIRKALEAMAKKILGGEATDESTIISSPSVGHVPVAGMQEPLPEKKVATIAPPPSEGSAELIAFNTFKSWFITELGFAGQLSEHYAHLFGSKGIGNVDRLKRMLKRNINLLIEWDIDPIDAEDILENLFPLAEKSVTPASSPNETNVAPASSPASSESIECTLFYRVVYSGGMNIRRGIELSNSLVKSYVQGAEIEVDPLIEVASCKSVRVKLRDGSGWTSIFTAGGERLMELVKIDSLLKFRVIYSGGINIRGGIELSNSLVKSYVQGAEIEVDPLIEVASCKSVRVKLRDGSGWTSIFTAGGERLMELVVL